MNLQEPAPAVDGDQERKCLWCGNRNLELVEEHPHPLFGILGMTVQVLRCDSPDCGRLTSY
jgi:hypothetical protein